MTSPLVVMATDSVEPSGVGEHMLTLARALAISHRTVLAFTMQHRARAFLERAKAVGIGTYVLGEPDAFGLWLRSEGAALVHVHAGIGWEGHELVEAGWRAGLRVLRTEHLPYLLTDEEQRTRHRVATSLAEALVTVSDASADSYRAEGYTRVVTIRNGIETPLPQRSRRETRAQLGVSEEVPLLITVARFTKQKGHRLLLEAAVQVTRHIPDAHFLLVGDGPEQPAMREFAGSLGLRNVGFAGESSEVPNLLAAADLFVLPSFFEGLPLVVLEAMAVGLPVVATSIGGTVEALSKSHPFLMPPGDAPQLATMIMAALDDPAGRRAVADASRQRFEKFFTAARLGKEMSELYQATIARSHVT